MAEVTNEHILAKIDGTIIPSMNIIKTEIAVINTKLDKMQILENKTDRLFTLILGDGTDKNKGIIQDVNSLKDWKDARVWLERAISVAVVGELVGLFYLMIRLVFIHQ
jgi:hypothetical protein